MHALPIIRFTVLHKVLVPRFKSITFSKFKDEGEIKKLKQALIKLMETEQEQETESCILHLMTQQFLLLSKNKNWTALDKLLGPEQLSQESPSLENELEKYLVEPPVSKKENPLSWQKANATHYNTLSSAARRLLCMPAATTSTERVISTARLTITKLRSRLKPKNADALIFLNKIKITKLISFMVCYYVVISVCMYLTVYKQLVTVFFTCLVYL